MTVETATARIGDVPAQHRVIGVAGVVVAGVDLHPVPVGIAQVDVEGVGHPVAAGAALDVPLLVQRAEDVASAQHLVRLVREEAQVVQARPGAAGEGDVVHGLLAEHPGGVQGLGVLDRLGQAEAQGPVVLVRGLHIGHHDVEVVHPGYLGPAAQVVALLEPVGGRRLVEELDGEAERVLGPDGRADPGGGPGRQARRAAAEAGVEVRGQVQVGGRAHPVGQPGGRGLGALGQDQVVMGQLVVAAQVQRAGAGLGDHEAEHVHPEPAGPGQVGDHELGVDAADDVGRRGRACGHGHDPSVPNRGTRASSRATCTMRESV